MFAVSFEMSDIRDCKCKRRLSTVSNLKNTPPPRDSSNSRLMQNSDDKSCCAIEKIITIGYH